MSAPALFQEGERNPGGRKTAGVFVCGGDLSEKPMNAGCQNPKRSDAKAAPAWHWRGQVITARYLFGQETRQAGWLGRKRDQPLLQCGALPLGIGRIARADVVVINPPAQCCPGLPFFVRQVARIGGDGVEIAIRNFAAGNCSAEQLGQARRVHTAILAGRLPLDQAEHAERQDSGGEQEETAAHTAHQLLRQRVRG